MCAPALLALGLTLAMCTPAGAQGSQRAIGGGCSNRSAPAFSGPLAIGTSVSFDSPGCFLGQGGAAVALWGTELSAGSWIPLMLPASVRGLELCHLVVQPLAVQDLSSLRFPIRLSIPLDPALVGASLSLQVLCRECGFAGCFTLLTQGLSLTIG